MSATRRLAGALLAALLLIASLASAAHAHPVLSDGASIIAESSGRIASDLACALCASGARLAHSVGLACFAAPPRAISRPGAARTDARAPRAVDLSTLEARTPPRNG